MKIELSGRGGWADASAAIDWLVESGVRFPEGSTIEASRFNLKVRILYKDKWCVLEPGAQLEVKVVEVGPEGGPLLSPRSKGGPVPGTSEWVTSYDPAVRPRHAEVRARPWDPDAPVNARCVAEPTLHVPTDLERRHRGFRDLVEEHRRKNRYGGFLVPSGVAEQILPPSVTAYRGADGKPLVTVFTDEARVNWPTVSKE